MSRTRPSTDHQEILMTSHATDLEAPPAPAAPIIDVPRLRKMLEWATAEALAAAAPTGRHLRGGVRAGGAWNQMGWVSSPTVEMPADAACGTFACLAGRTVIDAGYELVWETRATIFGGWQSVAVIDHHRTDCRVAVTIQDAARRELGVTDEQADELFSGTRDLHGLWETAHRITNGEITMPLELQL